MEIVLLWLDEIDDLLFAVLLRWERVRQHCLAVSLLAALMLHGARWWDITNAPELTFLNVSLLGILIWSCTSLASLFLDHRALGASPTA